MFNPLAKRLPRPLIALSLLLVLLGVLPAHAATTASPIIIPDEATTPMNVAPDALWWPHLSLQAVAGGFDKPIDVVSPNDGSNRLFVLEKGGLIHIIENGQRLEKPFLDISDRVSGCPECGLLGSAFPPDFAHKDYFFVYYTSDKDLAPPDTGDADPIDIGDTVVARFHLTNKRNVADADNEEQILLINQPAGNHNGGHLFFGPDNYLYIGMGDGGGEGDSFQNAQNPQSLLGKILRIEVGATLTYTIPSDNPFANTPNTRPEIWAYGLRNPWRFGFDAATGDLFVADVGQESTEEVNHIAAAEIGAEIGKGGMNFGWPIMEGEHCYPPNGPQACDNDGLILPVATFHHTEGDCAIAGGYVYHSQLPFATASYLYGDFCSGRMWGLQADGDSWRSTLLGEYPFSISSFGQDASGATYLVHYGEGDGVIYRLADPVNVNYLPTLSNHE